MFYFLLAVPAALRATEVVVRLVDKALTKPAAKARRKKNKCIGLDEELVELRGLGIVLPKREADWLSPEVIGRLKEGKDLCEDLHQMGVRT